MPDGQNERMRAAEEQWANERDTIERMCAADLGSPTRPDERDMIEAPRRPDLRCREHGGMCEAVRGLLARLEALELRVTTLEATENDRFTYYELPPA